MSEWGRLNGGIYSHPKFLMVNPSAVGLWTFALSWAIQHDEEILPTTLLPVLRGTDDDAASLVNAGLWILTQEGWRIHNFARYNRTDDVVKSQKESGKWAAHVRHHQGKGIVKQSCGFCRKVSPHHAAHVRPNDTPYENRITEEQEQEQVGASKDAPTAPSPQAATTGRNTYPKDFEEFWAIYPRRAGKGQAFKSWQQARKSMSAAAIILAAKRYADDPNQPQDRSKIPHPSTWLHQQRWDDDPLPARLESRRVSPGDQGMLLAAEFDYPDYPELPQ